MASLVAVNYFYIYVRTPYFQYDNLTKPFYEKKGVQVGNDFTNNSELYIALESLIGELLAVVSHG